MWISCWAFWDGHTGVHSGALGCTVHWGALWYTWVHSGTLRHTGVLSGTLGPRAWPNISHLTTPIQLKDHSMDWVHTHEKWRKIYRCVERTRWKHKHQSKHIKGRMVYLSVSPWVITLLIFSFQIIASQYFIPQWSLSDNLLMKPRMFHLQKYRLCDEVTVEEAIAPKMKIVATYIKQ